MGLEALESWPAPARRALAVSGRPTGSDDTWNLRVSLQFEAISRPETPDWDSELVSELFQTCLRLRAKSRCDRGAMWWLCPGGGLGRQLHATEEEKSLLLRAAAAEIHLKAPKRSGKHAVRGTRAAAAGKRNRPRHFVSYWKTHSNLVTCSYACPYAGLLPFRPLRL